MNPELHSKLATIFAYPFFSSVGEPLPPSVSQINTWTKAVKECNSNKWENCRLMAGNTLQRFVEQRRWERTRDWNPVTDELRPPIISFVTTLLEAKKIPPEIANKIRHKLSWDIMGICLEYEFRDVVPPFFYVPLLDPWYAKGHFPCGWNGEEFPERWNGYMGDGKLIVF